VFADRASKMRRWNKIIYNRDASIAPRLINLGARKKAAVKLTDSKTGVNPRSFLSHEKAFGDVIYEAYASDIYVKFRRKLQFFQYWPVMSKVYSHSLLSSNFLF